jgi:hypothetical protein
VTGFWRAEISASDLPLVEREKLKVVLDFSGWDEAMAGSTITASTLFDWVFRPGRRLFTPVTSEL